VSSLYRKWRSRSFDDLVGQPHVVRTLRNGVRQGRLAHAYLFTGPRGTGKTSMARILAKAVNCQNPDNGNPCNQCEMCRDANEGRAMDVIEIDAASNTSVENVRDLRERVAYAAGEGQYKVYIVDEVHRLSGAAFDAFLKTLEEPPPHVIFVFASTEPHKVPATITSRCQRFDFRRIPADEAFARLRYVAGQEELSVSDAALRLIVQNGNGSLRDDLGLLDQVAAYTADEITDSDVRTTLGLADPLLVARLTDAILDSEVGAGLTELGAFVDAGGDPRQLLRQFIDYWRALLLAVTGTNRPAEIDPALLEMLPGHAGRLREPQVIAVLRAMTEQEFSPKFNVPLQLPLELGFVEAVLAYGGNGTTPRTSSSPGISAVTSTSPPVVAPPQRIPEASPRPVEPVESVRERPPTIERTPVSDLDGAWSDVMARMQNRGHRSIAAILRSGHVLRTENGEIVIGFLHAFHHNQLADAKKRRLVEEVVEEVMGVAYRVTCVRCTREDVEAVKGAGSMDQDDGFVDEAAERLRAYHGKQLRNGDS
jgi:DNA polymerase-3 subunit gamma/tau